jgi:hypothetical protein
LESQARLEAKLATKKKTTKRWLVVLQGEISERGAKRWFSHLYVLPGLHNT